ncbi:MAG: MarC family protein, partial [Cyanobacteria bacterium J06641_5]
MSGILPDFLDFALNGFVSLFPVTDPVGAILVFLTVAAGASMEVRQRVALRAALYSVLVLICFLLLGDGILNFFGISVATVKIAGGIVVFATGWETLNETQGPTAAEDAAAVDRPQAVSPDVAFIPLTVPMLAGPGAISVT